MKPTQRVRWVAPSGARGQECFELPSEATELAFLLAAQGFTVLCERVMLDEPERAEAAERN